MDVTLGSNYYVSLDGINPRSQCVLKPDNSKGNSRVAQLDSKGQLYITEIKNGEMNIIHKGQQSRKDVSRIEKVAGKQRKDRVTFALGSYVYAYNKEGKSYFSFDSNLTEALKYVCVEEYGVWTVGEYMINYFEVVNNEINDVNYFLCPAQIIDCFIHSLDGYNFCAILSCKDKVIRIQDSKKNEIMFTFKLPSVCSCIEPFEDYEATECISKKKLTKKLLFGLETGEVMCFELNDKCPNLLWVFGGDENASINVTLMKTNDFSAKGKADIILCRENGLIEVWGEASDAHWELRGSLKLDEPVVGMDTGSFTDSKVPEILLGTYSGKILGVYDEDRLKPLLASKVGKVNNAEMDKKIKEVQMEIEKLNSELDKMKNNVTDEKIITTTSNKVNWKMSKIEKTNFFKIILDSQYPIDSILIECSRSVLIQSLESSGIFSETPKEFSNTHNFYTLNFNEEPCNQVEFKVRQLEIGSEGQLTCLVIPILDSCIAQTVHVPIKPLGQGGDIKKYLKNPKSYKKIRFCRTFEFDIELN